MADVKKLKIDGTNYDVKIPSENVKLMTGYSKGSSTNAITPSDSLNSAVGKLECRADKNQANVLYALDKIGTNLFDIASPDSTRTTDVALLDNGGATLSCSNASWTQYYKAIPTNIGQKYKIVAYVDSLTNVSGDQFVIVFRTNNSGGTEYTSFRSITTTGTNEALITASSSNLFVGIYINNSGTSKSSSVNLRIMICTEEEWNRLQSFQPYGAPNYDLTRLEAEDRAALAEVVDSGAKNRFKYDSWNGCAVSSGTAVYENNGVTLTSTGNDCFTVYTSSEFPADARITGKTGETIVISWDYEVADGVEGQLYIFPNATTTGMVYGNIRDKKVEYTFTSGISYITFRCGVRGNGNVAKYKNIMCSTKVAFAVSSKFVPYRAIPQLTELNKRTVVPVVQAFSKVDDLSFTVPSGYTAIVFLTGFANVTSVMGLKCIAGDVTYGLVEDSTTQSRHGLSTTFMISASFDINVDVYVSYVQTVSSATDSIRLLVQFRKTTV